MRNPDGSLLCSRLVALTQNSDESGLLRRRRYLLGVDAVVRRRWQRRAAARPVVAVCLAAKTTAVRCAPLDGGASETSLSYHAFCHKHLSAAICLC
jgi:hypothetical protein